MTPLPAPLPALTTVRRTTPGARPVGATPPPLESLLHATPAPVEASHVTVAGLEVPGLPAAAKRFLAELLRAGVLTAEALPPFFLKLGERVGQLNSRERTADALTAYKALTQYVATRALAGHYQGLVFGGYRVQDRMNSGSVGIVFRGEHLVMRRPVAIKAMALEESVRPELVERFFREVHMLSRLDHPNVVTIYDAGKLPEAGGQAGLVYLVMELLPGGDLENYVYEHGTQSVGTACEWVRQAGMGLAACHAAGYIHRDLKPSNLLLSDTKTVKLIDFGLARDFASTKTSPQVLLGSVEFLAPEQLLDAPTAGEPADIYSLGATLFWLLTGQLPYPQHARTSDAIAAIKAGPPRRLRELRTDLPEALDKLLSRMLAWQPGGRPTAAQVARELGKFAAPSPTAGSPEPASEVDGLRQLVQHLEGTTRTTTFQLEVARGATVAALAEAAAVRPGESKVHQARVAETTRLLATWLSNGPDWVMFADPRVVAELSRAATLHDLGLVGTPDEVITAVGKRSPADRHAYEQHPLVGEAMLDALGQSHGDALPFLRLARAAVRHHHERFDGAGFPDGLADDHISPAARVVAVAVAYEESRRTHDAPDAASMIRAGSRAAYDPAVVEAFEAVMADIERHYDENPDGPTIDLVPA